MARITFRDWRPSQESLDLVLTCNNIIEELSEFNSHSVSSTTSL